MKCMTKSTLALSIAVLMSTSIYADVIPNSGQFLQEQQQNTLKQPQPKAELTENIQKSSGLEGDTLIKVNQIIFEGNTEFHSNTLHGLVASIENKSVSLSELQQYVDKVTKFYQQQGFEYSRAYLPQQTLTNGQVTIAVLEAKIDKVNVSNQSKTQDWLIQSTLAPLKSGEHLNYNQVQQQLKLLDRLNGVSTRNVLSPGENVGTSLLNIELRDQKPFQGVVGLDNLGNEYVGDIRYNAAISANNLMGLGDQLSLDVMTTGQGLNYGKIGYFATVSGSGTQLGLSQSYLEYELGKELKVLDAEGIAANTSAWIKQPLLFSHKAEVFLTLQYDHKILEDDIKINQFYKHRDVDALTIKIDASQFDNLGLGGLTQYGFSSTYGKLDYKNYVAEFLDDNSAKTKGEYYSHNIYLTRLQNLTQRGTQAFVSLYGQYSPYNLDNSEQYILGGAYSVRGYDQSQFSGSSGFLASAELREGLYQGQGHRLMGKIFVDYGRVQLNANPWAVVTGRNYINASSAGLGLQWNHVWDIQAQLDVAFPLGDKPGQLAKRDDQQVWFSVKKHF